MALSSPGIGSGFDVKSIVSQLMTVESQPLIRLNEKEATIQGQISTYGILKSNLSAVQTAVAQFKDTTALLATKASSADTNILTVSSDTNALTASYDVTIDRLAQQHKTGSTEFASTATFGGTAGDELIITVDTTSFTVDLTTAQTLSEIQEAINVQTNDTGVAAGLITGDSSNQTLVLTSGTSGYDNRVQLSFSGAINAGTFNFAMLNRDVNDVLLATENELDASLTIDGVALTRSTNSVTDAVSGLTLSLQSTGQTTAAITQDTSVAKNALQNFVNAYNTLHDQFTTTSNTSSNRSILRNIESQLRRSFNEEHTGLGDYAYLSQIGVSTNEDTGKLELNGTTFTTALETAPDSVVAYFTDSTNGFAIKNDALITTFVQSGGTLDNIIDGANQQISNIAQNRTSLTQHLQSIEKRYYDQFSALDTLMASMTATSNFLTQQLDGIANMMKKK